MIDSLVEETGRDLKWVCDYIGAVYNPNGVSFYIKLPRRRNSFIGIGMAFGQPLEVINEWIVRFGNKKRLYPKDVTEDLIWIYLINASASDPDGSRNYFRMYDECREAALTIYNELWNEIVSHDENTETVGSGLSDVMYDKDFRGLVDFVADHLDAFKTAYSKSRTYLDGFACTLLDTFRACGSEKFAHLSDLRGWLDDSMINYLTGDSRMINVIDLATGKKTRRIKHVPKGKNTHISLCLALGMDHEETDKYLGMMGFSPLDSENKSESLLIKGLDKWEEAHPDIKALKDRCIGKKTAGAADSCNSEWTAGRMARDPGKDLKAAEDMLCLRQELKKFYRDEAVVFPY